MKIIKSDGVNRHLLFSNPKTNHGWFDIVTWEGCLCIHGDYGTYVFTRLPDMFDFFRSHDGEINPYYWSQKVVSVDRDSAISEFSKQAFTEAVKEAIEELVEDESAKDKVEIWQAVQDEVLSKIDDDNDGMAAKIALRDFEYLTEGDERLQIYDFEYDTTEYSVRYIWNLNAIIWAVAKFEQGEAKCEDNIL